MAETLFSLTSSANKRDLVRRLLLLALLSAVALVFTWTKATAQNVSSAVIASFSEDFAPGSPGPGWSYLWNANGLLGDSANYEAMQWIGGAQYAGGAGIPNVTNFTFGIVETNLVHPGLGAAQGEVTNRYAVARYTVANDGTYFLVNSSATLLDNSCSDGVEIVVFTNDSPVANTLVTGASRAIFDLTLGALVAGDIVDVAIGPNGNSDCDLTIVDWEISFLPATTPGSEVTYIFESAPSGLRIDFNDASQATPFGVLLPVGGNLDIAAPNQQLYAFDSWSNGGEIAQRLTVGNTDETLIATFLDLAASGGSIVAGYSDDWSNGPAPPAGWAYLWNSTSVLGDAAGYSALQWNGTQYAATAPSGLPNAYRFSWNNVTADLVSPGPGIQQGESTDRYEITRYTASQTGMYYLVNSSLSILSSTCSNGVDIVVLRNDEPLATVANEPGARQPFDLTLGYLAVGDSVDVAVGPNGDSACDTSVIDWELFLIPGLPGNTPPELRAFESESVAEGNSLTVPLSASDADGDGLTFTLPDPPEFASLTDNDDGTGSIALNPAPGDAGTYALTVTVTDDGSPAASDTETLTVTVTGTAATPVMTPAGGVFEGPVQVSLSTATSGATICYTLDGTDPDEASLEYSGTPVPISVDAKLKAKAFKAGLNASGIASADFLFEPLPSAGLVGHWSLDEGSGTLAGDSSSNNNDGNLGSNAAWERTGYLGGNALTVNGTADSHVRVADDLSLRFAAGDDYTVSFWVRINAYPGTWQTMLWRGDDAARYAFFVTPDNKLLFTSGANNAIRSSVELASGSWQHVMAVQEAGHPSRKRRLYINGVEVASSPTAQPADGLGDLFIGSRRADSYEAFAGDLDEVRIYNRALLDEEVLTLSGRSVPSAGMAGRWSLDEGSGAVAGDSSTNNNDGTLGSNAAWEGTGYLGGNALTVDATADSHVRVADDASLRFATSDDYTVSFWVRINAYPGTWQTMLWRGDDAARYAFFVTPDNKLLFTSGANNAIRSSVELAVGSWQHVMAVQEAGHPSRRRRLYINGVEVASSPAAQPADGLGDLFIGSRRADSYEAFAGDLDEVRIYNRALLDEEILSFSGQNAPPIANAGPNLTLVDWDDSGSEPVTLDGSASTDPDGTIVNYRWVEGVTVLAEGATPTAAVDLAVGTHTIALDVTDNDARTVTDTIIVTISPQPPNSAPVVDAGPDLTIKLGDRFYIDSASVTDDPLPITPGIVSVLWTEQGSSVATWPLADQTSVDTHVEFSAVGTYTLRLTADDGELTAFDELSVTVLEFGLDTRASNPNCVAPPRPTAGASAATEDPFPASPGFNRITKILQAPGDASRWFVLEQAGRVQVFDVADPATVQTYLDFSASVRDVGNEEGLLGMAFHPNFPTVPELFVNYIAGTSDATRHSRVSRFILDDPVAPVVVTEQILLTVDQPRDNHNGGELSFGPDGYLYLGLGDGGGDGDTFDNAQNTTNLLGSMLRIDVLGVPFPAPGYQVPPDNPFAGNPRCGPTASHADSCPELYAWGLRNPWRWSFDAPTGQLWLADVGEVGWEEVDLIKRGGNYGWDCREGAHDFELDGCPAGGLIDPVFEYQRGQGWAITGGYVYRNTTIPGLAGRYVFGDYGSGRIWALQPDGQGGYLKEELIDTPWPISTFGLGVDGELYFADFANGRLRRLVAAGPGNPDTIPDNLADTGCVDPVDPTQPAPGLIPYTINAPFWSDDAVKTRWLALPDGTSIDIDASDDFVFPNGAVIVKNFALNDQLVETRLLMRHPDGFWGGYTYEWNDTVTAATRVRGGKTRAVGGQQWIYPSEGECLNCHTSAAGFSLGPELAQLNGDLNYPSTGITANQLETLDHILLFTDPLPGPASTLPAIPDPADITAPLAERARAYLDINCSGCHRPTGPTPSGMDLRYPTAFPATNTCDVLPVGDDLDIGPTARLIAPGNSAASLIPARMNRRDAHGMPPLGSAIADGVGVSLIDAWIDSLTNCN